MASRDVHKLNNLPAVSNPLPFQITYSTVVTQSAVFTTLKYPNSKHFFQISRTKCARIRLGQETTLSLSALVESNPDLSSG